MEDKKILSLDELNAVSGGQYDEEAEFLPGRILGPCDLYFKSPFDKIARKLPGAVDVMVHPSFIVRNCDESTGYREVFLNLIKLDGVEYCVEYTNVTPNVAP